MDFVRNVTEIDSNAVGDNDIGCCLNCARSYSGVKELCFLERRFVHNVGVSLVHRGGKLSFLLVRQSSISASSMGISLRLRIVTFSGAMSRETTSLY